MGMFGPTQAEFDELVRKVENIRLEFSEYKRKVEVLQEDSIESLKDTQALLVKENQESRENVRILAEAIEKRATSEEVEHCRTNLGELFNALASIQNESKQQDTKIAAVNKGLIDVLQSVQELSELVDSDKEELTKKCRDSRDKQNADLKGTNKNFRYLNDKVKSLQNKFEALLEVVSEKLTQHEEFPDIFSSHMTVDAILKKVKNPDKASLYALVFMAKKHFQDKGIKV